MWKSNNTRFSVSPSVAHRRSRSRDRLVLAVLPPDEDAVPFQNNSVYTNAVASLSIRLASAVSCVTGKVVPQTWLDIASNLHFPFDNVSQIHLEYEGFNPR